MKALIWKIQRKNTRKCSKVSVKKYQNRPRLGAWSGTVRLEGKGSESVTNISCAQLSLVTHCVKDFLLTTKERQGLASRLLCYSHDTMHSMDKIPRSSEVIGREEE